MYPPRNSCWHLVLASLCLATADLHALEIRGYKQSQHARLYQFPGAPRFPQVPVINPTFSPAASLFRGIGWPADRVDWFRNTTLVSPRHLILAAHYPLDPSWKIAFLGSDGKQHEVGIASQQVVLNDQNQATDLLLCTLSKSVPSGRGLSPFRILNLENEADYVTKTMRVCGKTVDVGKTTINGFTTLSNDPGFDTTRFIYFDYNAALSGQVGECNYEGGDSGSPAFVMVDGEPLLVGTASGQDPLPGGAKRNFVSFIPAYLSHIDGMMEAEGYHLKRFFTAKPSLHTTSAAVGNLRQSKAGTVRWSVANSSGNAAHNLSFKLTFSQAPSTVSGPGWICEMKSPTIWTCLRGGLAAGETATVTAKWTTLPVAAKMTIQSKRSADATSAENLAWTFPLDKL